MYEVLFSDNAKKQFKSLDGIVKRRIGLVLERIKQRPHRFVIKLVRSQYYRLKVGKNRVILDIKEEKIVIYIIELDHRKKIYKR
jgi:mRNA interferase RelE/StbE